MKIVLIGGSGMLGVVLEKYLRIQKDISETITISRSGSDINMNCLNTFKLKETLIRLKPDLVINCAAIVNLSLCESDKSLAFKTHVELSQFLSEQNCRNIYISTDSVYSGDKKDWSETDIPNPINYYAHSKLLGESPIIASGGVVLRTNIYGSKSDLSGNSLFEWGYKSAKNKEEISGYKDVYFNPVSTFQLSEAIYSILKLYSTLSGQILNVGSDVSISKYDFLKKLYVLCNVDSKHVIPSVLIDNEIVRPRNTSMNLTKFNAIFSSRYSIDSGLKSVFSSVRC